MFGLLLLMSSCLVVPAIVIFNQLFNVLCSWIKSIFSDVDIVSTEPIAEDKKLDTVIIVGASTTGLTTAIQIAPLCKKVIILESGEKPANNQAMAYVKGCQPHVICPRSIEILNKLIPGFSERLIKINETNINNGKQNQIFTPNRIAYNFGEFKFTKQNGGGPIINEVTRGVLEQELRNDIEEKYSNITILYNNKLNASDINIEEFDVNGTKQYNIKDVVIGTGSNTFKQPCDILINCAGIGQYNLFTNIIKKTGGSMKKVDIKTKITYKSVVFNFRKDVIKNGDYIDILKGKSIVYHGILWPSKIGLLVKPYDSKLMVNIHTYDDAQLDTVGEETAKEDLLKLLGDNQAMKQDLKQIFESLDDENVQVFKSYQKEGSNFVHYENINCGGVIALGDATCSLNPIYGQGITIGITSSILFASKLRRQLLENSNTLMEFYNNIRNEITNHYFVPWLLAGGTDLKFEHVKTNWIGEGAKYLIGNLCYYSTRLYFQACVVSPTFIDKLLKVLYLENGFRKGFLMLSLHAIIGIIRKK